MNPKNILLTGLPGCGKTTLIRKLASNLHDLSPVGFYTTEIRTSGTREGFELVGLDDRKSILSHVSIKSPYRVGKYGVDIPAFEAFLDGFSLSGPGHSVVVIDEIGKMECLSVRFRKLVETTLSSPPPCVATIALRGDRFIEGIKQRHDVELVRVTAENRNQLLASLSIAIRALVR
jgi:nucleoside-triphosphatase